MYEMENEVDELVKENSDLSAHTYRHALGVMKDSESTTADKVGVAAKIANEVAKDTPLLWHILSEINSELGGTYFMGACDVRYEGDGVAIENTMVGNELYIEEETIEEFLEGIRNDR